MVEFGVHARDADCTIAIADLCFMTAQVFLSKPGVKPMGIHLSYHMISSY